MFVIYGYRKFEKSKLKVEKVIYAYYHKMRGAQVSSASKVNLTDELNVSEASLNTGTNASTDTGSVSALDNAFKFLKLYKENFVSSVLFLLYSVLRALFFYEAFIVFKYTNDALFVVNIFAELLVLFVWAILLVLITVKVSWSFKINSSYKLVFWNFIHYQTKRQPSEGGSSSAGGNKSFSAKSSVLSSPKDVDTAVAVVFSSNESKQQLQQHRASTLKQLVRKLVRMLSLEITSTTPIAYWFAMIRF